MKKIYLYFSLLLITAITFTSCKKEITVASSTSLTTTDKSKLQAGTNAIASVNSTEYIYIANTGTITGSSLDGIDNWDTFRVYQDGSNRNLKVIWEARLAGKPTSPPVLIGPGFCFLGPYPNYFFDYSLESEWLALDRFGEIGNVVQKKYTIKIKKVIDTDTQEDITSQVNVFPAEGVQVQFTKNIYNNDWGGGGSGNN